MNFLTIVIKRRRLRSTDPITGTPDASVHTGSFSSNTEAKVTPLASHTDPASLELMGFIKRTYPRGLDAETIDLQTLEPGDQKVNVPFVPANL